MFFSFARGDHSLENGKDEKKRNVKRDLLANINEIVCCYSFAHANSLNTIYVRKNHSILHEAII